jgi:hypothetical protein
MAVAKEFNPTEFDARAIAKLAKAAGMKWIIITSFEYFIVCPQGDFTSFKIIFDHPG